MALLIDQQSAASEGNHVLDQNIDSCVSSQKVKHWVQMSLNDDEEPNATRARRPNHIKRPAHRPQARSPMLTPSAPVPSKHRD